MSPRSGIPILMLTALFALPDAVQGADDDKPQVVVQAVDFIASSDGVSKNENHVALDRYRLC